MNTFINLKVTNRLNLVTIFIVVFLFIISKSFASDVKDSLIINGYVDTYYAVDNDAKSNINRAALNSLDVQTNSFNINVALLSMTYQSKLYRGKITFHYGDMPNAAWTNKIAPIEEANVGVNLADKLWLDVGNFLTHIGAESILPKDNWLTSITLATQNEPFFQSGMKLSYEANDNLQIQLAILNGYNLFADNNVNKSVGYHLLYKINDDFNFWICGIYGNEQFLGLNPNPNFTYKHTPKLLNNFALNYNASKSLLFKLSFDLSNQNIDALDATEFNKSVTGKSTTMGGFLAVRYILSSKFSITGRAAMFNLESQIDKTYIQNALGGTIGIEFKPNTNSYLRLEARNLSYKKDALAINPFTSRNEGIFSFGVFF